MNRAYSFINGPGGSFVLAVVILVVAVIGHVPLPLALAMAGIMVAYGLFLLAGRRWDPIAVLSAPGQDERASQVHMRAAATAGQVLALVIVGGFFYDVARGALNQSIWPPLGAVFGITYLVAFLIAMRRG